MTAGVFAEAADQATLGGAGALGVAAALVGAFAVGLVWMGLTLGAVYRKVGARAGLAWIPVVRYAVMAHLTQSSVRGTVAARVVAGLGLIIWGVGATLGGANLVVLPALGVAAVAGLVAWAMWIVQTHRFGLDHGLPGGLPVLAAVAPGIWAAVVGWSAMVRPVTGPVPVVVPAPEAPTRDDAPVEQGVPVPAGAPTSPAVVDVAAMYPIEAFTGPDGYPEEPRHLVEPVTMPEPDPDPTREPHPEPHRVPATARIVTRQSPYAALAPEASAPSESAAWEAAVEAVPVAAPGTGPEPARALDPEPEAGPQPGPEAELAPEPDAVSDAPVYVEPTPTLPISPYMRGGAAAPPRAPASVPTFEMPQVAIPQVAPEAAAAEPSIDPLPWAVADTPPGYHSATIPPPPAPSVPAAASSGDYDDRTQVSARQREAWELISSEGGTYRFDASAVLLGRVGGLPPADGTPRLDLADSTRTVSKSHARLELRNGSWWVEDLNSTNGTYLVTSDGRETQVLEGVPAPVVGRLILGDIEVEIRRRSGE